MKYATRTIISLLTIIFGIWLITVVKKQPKTYNARYRIDYKETYRVSESNGDRITAFKFHLQPLDECKKCCKPDLNKRVTYNTYSKHELGDIVVFTESYCMPDFMLFISIVCIIIGLSGIVYMLCRIW